MTTLYHTIDIHIGMATITNAVLVPIIFLLSCVNLPLSLSQAATLGSQEGAFENVRLNLTGEQGQALRQLLANYDIRRVAMCALTSVKGKRQHLCVNHDKGKLTFLQLFPILKQADSSRRKLTLTVSNCCQYLSFYLILC